MKYTLIISLLLCLCLNGFSQKLSKQNCIADMDTLMQYIEEIHPNPYFVTPKDVIISRKNKIIASMTDSITYAQFYVYLSNLAAQYHDGHISVLFTKKLLDKRNLKILPFTAQIVDNNIFVKETSNSALPVGSKILEVNEISSKTMLDTMRSCQSGESISFRFVRISEIFQELFQSIYGNYNDFRIKYSLNNKIDSISLKPLNYKQYFDFANRKSTNKKKPYLYNSSIDKKLSTCIIDFKAFDDLDKFKLFLDSTFRDIKENKIKHLIIDLRENEGGNSALGDELFQYISNQAFHQFGKTLMKVSSHLKKLWVEVYLPTGVMTKEVVDDIKLQADGKIIESPDETLIPLRNNPLRYKGETFVLTSTKTFSSALDFACCFQHYKLGKVVGEETGGWVFSFGDMVHAYLPISNIRIHVSCKLFYCVGATDKDLHGVIPDISTKNKDALQYVLDQISKKK